MNEVRCCPLLTCQEYVTRTGDLACHPTEGSLIVNVSCVCRPNSMTQPQIWCAAIFLAFAFLRPGVYSSCQQQTVDMSTNAALCLVCRFRTANPCSCWFQPFSVRCGARPAQLTCRSVVWQSPDPCQWVDARICCSCACCYGGKFPTDSS